VDNLIFGVHALMVVLFAGWLCYFLLVLLNVPPPRPSRRRDYAGVKHHASTYLEALVALIEGALSHRSGCSALGSCRGTISQGQQARPMSPHQSHCRAIQLACVVSGANGEFAKQDKKFVSADDPYGLDKRTPISNPISSSPAIWWFRRISRGRLYHLAWMSSTVFHQAGCA